MAEKLFKGNDKVASITVNIQHAYPDTFNPPFHFAVVQLSNRTTIEMKE